MVNLTPQEIEQLKQIGIDIPLLDPASHITVKPLPTKKIKNPILPLLSISSFTLLSFLGLLKIRTSSDNQSENVTPPPKTNLPDQSLPTPTQVPKSIQHYLLTSQQYYSQALQIQNTTSDKPRNQELADNLNKSLLTASEAIKNFPSDYRGYEQRARIYQSVLDSQPQLIDQTIADFSQAYRLNTSSAEIARTLAALYARKGDVQNTIKHLLDTITLEPTKAQNFYDLARIQQQAGQVREALTTYNQLLSLVSDPSQKQEIESQTASLQNLLAQNPQIGTTPSTPPSLSPTSPVSLPDNPPTIQALADSGLIIAAPETSRKIEVNSLTDSNALSGEALLPAGQKEVVINNPNINTLSQIYLSLLKGGKNQTLKILSRSGNSFTAGFDSPLSEDVTFKWWIIK